jgi:hypothetical protein
MKYKIMKPFQRIRHTVERCRRSSVCRSTVSTTLLAFIVCLCGSEAKGDQQGYPATILELTNVTALQSNGVVSVWTNNYIPLRATGLGIQDVFTASNLVTAPVTLYFYPTVDGTNAFSAPWAQLNLPANGTNLVIGGTNWSQLQLRGFAGLYVAVSNGTGANVLQNQVQTNWFTGNTNVNGGLFFNRPNQ